MSEQQPANANLAIERFRILVIGNANAGKTTILNRVCHAKGREPDCFDRDGNRIPAELKPDTSRGEHDIEVSFQYPTAHGFVFHDSRGFEAGAASEMDTVEQFIIRRAQSEVLKDRLHAIWYCIPTSNDRPMTDAVKRLFEIDTGNVPIIAIFTKMDALEEKAFNKLLRQGIFDREKVAAEANATFERLYLEPLQAVTHKPQSIVRLRDMHKEGTDCDKLIMRTSENLNGETLTLFCLSVLRNDMESRIKHVINQIIIPKAREAHKSGSFLESLFNNVMSCFPYMLPSFLIMHVIAAQESQQEFSSQEKQFFRFFQFESEFQNQFEQQEKLFQFNKEIKHLEQSFKALSSSMPFMMSLQCQAVWVGIMTVAIADLCLFTSLSQSLEDFKKAIDFCKQWSSYPALKSVIEKECTIANADVITLLGTLKANRDSYKA